MARRILFIVNPIAGGGRAVKRISRILPAILKNKKYEYEIRFTSERGHATRLAERGVKEGFDVIVAVGGDGTVNETATGLVGTDKSLGIIPSGSGDGIARGLNLSLMLRRAVDILFEEKSSLIDVGMVGDRYFFATNGMGFDAVIGKLFDEGTIRGPLPYFYFGIREFFNYKPKEYILNFDGHQVQVKALIVAVANTSQFGNGAIIAPFARPDDGLLDICVIRDVNAFHAILDLPKLFTGHLSKSEYYEFYQAKQVEVVRPEPAPIHVDGEPLDGEKVLNVKVLPKALSVIKPQKTTANNYLNFHLEKAFRLK
ncbi:diacylglycerol kinase family lipid kinase [candidate division KSB1 bacterium]|nr:diacylglycerol kinase family lipid kinase [candidate division KSB1 bacterium]